MRISRRSSGGRGEYEVRGQVPDGTYARRYAAGQVIVFDLGALWSFNTNVKVSGQGGKPRLRLAGADIHAHKQLAAALLMPDPVRDDDALGAGEPVLQRGRYAIEHIEVSNPFKTSPNLLTLQVDTFTAVNHSHSDEISVRDRVQLLTKVREKSTEFPEEIASLLDEHKNEAKHGPITAHTERLVVRLQEAVADVSSDLGIIYSERADVLPALAESLNVQIPKPLLAIDAGDPLDVELKERAVKEWKRWANARGPANSKFKQLVRKAYCATCVMCGLHFPPTPLSTSPGVDALHILPWSDCDLDEVFNGLCLCKLHHWAFDESLLRIRFDNGQYFTELLPTTEVAVLSHSPYFSMAELRKSIGLIPQGRLPSDPAQWPRPALLSALYGEP